MKINYNKLVDLSNVEIQADTQMAEEIIEYEEILYEISKSIKDYRKEHKLTQKQLAKILDIDQVMVSKLESGNYNPTFKQIHKISRRLTESSELFVDTLQNIIKNLNDMYSKEYALNNIRSYSFEFDLDEDLLYKSNFVREEEGELYETEYDSSIIPVAG